MVVISCLIRFLAQSNHGSEAALATIRRVVFPLLRLPLISTWALVFISALKALKATFLSALPGFDTTPIRIDIHPVEAEYGLPSAWDLNRVLCTGIARTWLFAQTRPVP